MNPTMEKKPQHGAPSSADEHPVEARGDVVELAMDSYTEEEERRVLRKIDYTILPMVCQGFSSKCRTVYVFDRNSALMMLLTMCRCASFSSSNTSTSNP
jgi:hypothetical protein